MFRAALRSLLARKVRLLLTGLSVVLGVSFVAGTYVLTDTMTQAFDDLIETSTVGIDVIVQGEQEFESPNGPGSEERQPLPEELVDEISAVEGVAVAAGDVLGFAAIVDPATGDVIGGFGPPTFGASFSEFGGFTVKAGAKPAGPGQVAIDAGTAELYGIGIGDRVQILFEGTPQEFEVVGLAGFGVADNLGGATFALFDFETAQQVLNREGQVDAIYIQGEQDVTALALRDRIAQVLPPNVEALTGAAAAQEAQDQVGQALGFVRTALLVFAFVSLFVGAFIIFNTFAIIVAQRTRELALLRALGASRRQVMTSVLVEAAIIGLIASLIGFGAGILIAIGLKGLLGAVGIDLPSTGTVIETRTFVVSIVVGTLITLIASLVPARRASRVAPIQALREAVDTGGRSLRFRLITGIAVLALGVVPLLYGLFGAPENALQLVGFGVAFTFIGVAMLTPFIARPVAGILGAPVRRTGISAKLGRENAMRSPRRTAATASALMIGLGLVVFVAVFGASAKASVDSTLERTLRAEFIAISPSFTGFGPAAADAMRDVPGVEALSELRQTGVQIDGKTAFLSAVDPATLDLVTNLDVQAGSTSSLSDPSTVLVFEDVATDNAWSVGDEIELTFASTGAQPFTIGGIYAEKGIVDDYTISLEAYEENVPQQLDLLVLVTAEEGADLGAVEDGLVAAVEEFPNVEVQDQTAFRDMYASFVNQILNIVTVLLLLAVFIALFGVMNTLYLSIYERTRELGLLRAVGLSRRQTRSMVRWEAAIIAIMGALFGVVIGIAFGWALQQALAPQGFTELGVPGGQIALYVVLAALFGVLLAIFPARRAAKLNVLQALSYE